MSDKRNVAKKFDFILKYIKDSKKVTKLLNVKCRDENIDLYMVITKFINGKTIVLEIMNLIFLMK